MEAQKANLCNKKNVRMKSENRNMRSPFTETLSLPSTFTIDRSEFGTTTPRRRYLR
jgi:hypothetical protein